MRVRDAVALSALLGALIGALVWIANIPLPDYKADRLDSFPVEPPQKP